MLNKEICIICCNDAKIKFSADPWLEEDEELWTEGKLRCAYGHFGELQFYISKGPPECCPYNLEHIIKQERINVK